MVGIGFHISFQYLVKLNTFVKMPGLLNTLEELFGTKDLYAVLDVEKGVEESKIKKAYHKTSLKVHPDRAKPEDREEATKKFQALGAVYKILSDKDARALYDERYVKTYI